MNALQLSVNHNLMCILTVQSNTHLLANDTYEN